MCAAITPPQSSDDEARPAPPGKGADPALGSVAAKALMFQGGASAPSVRQVRGRV